MSLTKTASCQLLTTTVFSTRTQSQLTERFTQTVGYQDNRRTEASDLSMSPVNSPLDYSQNSNYTIESGDVGISENECLDLCTQGPLVKNNETILKLKEYPITLHDNSSKFQSSSLSVASEADLRVSEYRRDSVEQLELATRSNRYSDYSKSHELSSSSDHHSKVEYYGDNHAPSTSYQQNESGRQQLRDGVRHNTIAIGSSYTDDSSYRPSFLNKKLQRKHKSVYDLTKEAAELNYQIVRPREELPDPSSMWRPWH